MRHSLTLLLILGACASEPMDPDPVGGDTDLPLGFEPFVGVASAPDALHERLCVGIDDPGALADPVQIDCALEGANLAAPDPEPVESLVIWAYNLERGHHLDGQIALVDAGVLPPPDVLLVSEADRGCARTAGRNVPWELAEALGMNYVFATEFVELPRPDPMGADDDSCEHGNLVASRFPIGNVGAVRHAANRSWLDAGERRLGGRIVVHADIRVGDRQLGLYSVHWASNPTDVDIQIAQAEETAALALQGDRPVVVGGDTNAPFYGLDLYGGSDADRTISALLDRGFVDAHRDLEPQTRATIDGGFVIDLILVHGLDVVDAGVCAESDCAGLSDHLPVWARIDLPKR